MADGDARVPARGAITRRAFAFGAAAALPALAQLPYEAFEYNRPKFQPEFLKREKRGAVQVSDMTYVNTWGQRTAAYLVEPAAKRRGPGILWVHWYEPKSPTSNRSQFLQQAIELAEDGAVSLLPETMWSDPDWFKKRRPEMDYVETLRQVHELRRALDLLESHKKVEGLAYVGHDFGAMFGAVIAGADSRPMAYALQAGAPRFSDWYLLGRKLDDVGRAKVVKEMTPVDPIEYIGRATPSRVLWQFGQKDPYVPEAKAWALWEATREPKDMLWYDAGHELNDQAVENRQRWLRKYLKLTAS